MKSKDLAIAVGDVVKLAQTRIEGVGAEQYTNANDSQKFETMSIPELLEYMEEELLDQINYAVMNYMRVHNVKQEMIALTSKLDALGLGQEGVIGEIKKGTKFTRSLGHAHLSHLSFLRRESEDIKNPEKPLNLA